MLRRHYVFFIHYFDAYCCCCCRHFDLLFAYAAFALLCYALMMMVHGNCGNTVRAIHTAYRYQHTYAITLFAIADIAITPRFSSAALRR